MAQIRPFYAIRPAKGSAARVAALPYDVYSRQEARAEVEREPLSFLKIDRAEIQFPDDVDPSEDRVYRKARETLEQMEREGIYLLDPETGYYIYRLTMEGRPQTGIVACASVDDYLGDVIKKHENTRQEKELDRIRHVDVLGAQTGPIFLAYRSRSEIASVVASVTDHQEPLYDFTATDGVSHTVWKVADPGQMAVIRDTFSDVDDIYIADGHHRAASAVKVCLKRRREHPDYDGSEEFNYFLSVLFPDDQLTIMDYNRCVRDLNGLSVQEFLDRTAEAFAVSRLGTEARAPQRKGQFTMYLEGEWYLLEASAGMLSVKDAVRSLDVSLLQDHLLGPVLGIQDPRTDERIDFVGGIRGLRELERRADGDMKVSFAVYPMSIAELFAVADAGRLMPPKSTWFEPKLRSGLFIHRI